jgi:DNA-binding NarL/FixJ family response regulator
MGTASLSQEPMMESLRVAIADDHPVFRDGLRALLSSLPDVEVVGEASTGEEAVTLARQLHPDVVVMDLNMPGVNGIEATRRIIDDDPHANVLMLTMFEDDDSVFAAMRAGARGYLVKGSKQTEVVRAIEAVAAGEAVFGAPIAQRMIDYFSRVRTESGEPAFPQLTERERQVLDLIAQGHSNQTITQRLVLSPKTVRNHVSNIFAKLQVADRAEAIVRAREAGLGRRHERPE